MIWTGGISTILLTFLPVLLKVLHYIHGKNEINYGSSMEGQGLFLSSASLMEVLGSYKWYKKFPRLIITFQRLPNPDPVCA